MGLCCLRMLVDMMCGFMSTIGSFSQGRAAHTKEIFHPCWVLFEDANT